MTDESLAAFATPAWVARVGAVPLDEMSCMVAEDPSVITALVGALQHARAELASAEAATTERIAVWIDDISDRYESHPNPMLLAADIRAGLYLAATRSKP